MENYWKVLHIIDYCDINKKSFHVFVDFFLIHPYNRIIGITVNSYWTSKSKLMCILHKNDTCGGNENWIQ